MSMNPITYGMKLHHCTSLAALYTALETVTLPLREALGVKSPFPILPDLSEMPLEALQETQSVNRLANLLQRDHLAVMGVTDEACCGEPNTSVEETLETVFANLRKHFYVLSRLPLANLGDHTPSVTCAALRQPQFADTLEATLDFLCSVALFLRKLEGFTGIRMCLALDYSVESPLNTVQRTIAFFERLWQHHRWNPAYRYYIGLCFHTCQHVIERETPLRALQQLVSSKIPVARIRLTTTPIENIASEPPMALERLTPSFWRYVRAGGWAIEVEPYVSVANAQRGKMKTVSECLYEDLRWVTQQLGKV